jgi:hypothetical protein
LPLEIFGTAKPTFELVIVVAAEVENNHVLPEIVLNKDEVVPGTGVEPVRLSAPDFKSTPQANNHTSSLRNTLIISDNVVFDCAYPWS